MADTSEASEMDKTTVAAAANQCLESFHKCLPQESPIHPRELSLVEDQVARFSTWTSGIGVFAPGRASMDHRLRYAPEVQSVTIGLLESLNYRIQKLAEALDTHAKGQETNTSSVVSEGLGRLLGDIATEISHLNKMSNIIRRASQETHNLQAKDFQIKDEEGNVVEPLLLGHYKHYIRDRCPAASVTIQQRLADAMILRRKRILYRRSRHGNRAIQLPKAEPKVSITLPDSHPPPEDNQKAKAPSQVKSATTLQPDKFKMAASSPSVVSATKTVALGSHEALNFPIAPGLHVKRKHGQSIAQPAMLTKFDELSPTTDSTPDPDSAQKDAEERAAAEEQLRNTLKSDMQAIGEITCPYCLYALPIEEVFNKQKWQNHVKNDLDPYVCLFEECSQPDELYKHSQKWLSHVHQHGQRWRCSSHRELGLFSSCEEYMQHMRDVHDANLSDVKLRALANRNARSIPKLFPSCPLCGQDESEINGRLTDHITGHLRSIALMSLPSYYEDIPDDAESAEDSSYGLQALSRSTVNLLDDDDMSEFRSNENEDLDAIGPEFDIDSNHTDMGHSQVNEGISNNSLAQTSPLSMEGDPDLEASKKSLQEPENKSHEDSTVSKPTSDQDEETTDDLEFENASNNISHEVRQTDHLSSPSRPRSRTPPRVFFSSERPRSRTPPRFRSRPRPRLIYEDDIVIRRDLTPGELKSGRKDLSAEENKDEYPKLRRRAAFDGNGATKTWDIVDVPPETERILDSAATDTTWSKYSGVRRTKFVPERETDRDDLPNRAPSPPPALRGERVSVSVLDREREIEPDGVVVDRRASRSPAPPKEMWTEITKDLVIREAIEELGYEYEETDQFFYVMDYLKYDDVLQLTELSDDIRRSKRQRARDTIRFDRERDYYEEIDRRTYDRRSPPQRDRPERQTEIIYDRRPRFY